MNMIQCLKEAFINKPFDFKGKTDKKTYIKTFIGFILVGLILGIIYGLLSSFNSNKTVSDLLIIIFSIVLLYTAIVNISLCTRRLRDIGIIKNWQIALIIILGLITNLGMYIIYIFCLCYDSDRFLKDKTNEINTNKDETK